jgi:hypothetical protein
MRILYTWRGAAALVRWIIDVFGRWRDVMKIYDFDRIIACAASPKLLADLTRAGNLAITGRSNNVRSMGYRLISLAMPCHAL